MYIHTNKSAGLARSIPRTYLLRSWQEYEFQPWTYQLIFKKICEMDPWRIFLTFKLLTYCSAGSQSSVNVEHMKVLFGYKIELFNWFAIMIDFIYKSIFHTHTLEVIFLYLHFWHFTPTRKQSQICYRLMVIALLLHCKPVFYINQRQKYFGTTVAISQYEKYWCNIYI